MFREILESDDELIAIVGPDRIQSILDDAFDLSRALRHSHRTIDALKEVEG